MAAMDPSTGPGGPGGIGRDPNGVCPNRPSGRSSSSFASNFNPAPSMLSHTPSPHNAPAAHPQHGDVVRGVSPDNDGRQPGISGGSSSRPTINPNSSGRKRPRSTTPHSGARKNRSASGRDYLAQFSAGGGGGGETSQDDSPESESSGVGATTTSQNDSPGDNRPKPRRPLRTPRVRTTPASVHVPSSSAAKSNKSDRSSSTSETTTVRPSQLGTGSYLTDDGAGGGGEGLHGLEGGNNDDDEWGSNFLNVGDGPPPPPPEPTQNEQQQQQQQQWQQQQDERQEQYQQQQQYQQSREDQYDSYRQEQQQQNQYQPETDSQQDGYGYAPQTVQTQPTQDLRDRYDSYHHPPLPADLQHLRRGGGNSNNGNGAVDESYNESRGVQPGRRKKKKKKSKKRRMRHGLPGPAGVWFRVNNAGSLGAAKAEGLDGKEDKKVVVLDGDAAVNDVSGTVGSSTGKKEAEDGTNGAAEHAEGSGGSAAIVLDESQSQSQSQSQTDQGMQQSEAKRKASLLGTAWDCMSFSLNRVIPHPPPNRTQSYGAIRSALDGSHPNGANFTLLSELQSGTYDRLKVRHLIVSVGAVHCHGHCDWTVELHDETTVASGGGAKGDGNGDRRSGAGVTGWIEERFVRDRPEWVRPGVVWYCRDVSLAVFPGEEDDSAEDSRGSASAPGDAAAGNPPVGTGNQPPQPPTTGEAQAVVSGTVEKMLLIGESRVVIAWTPEDTLEDNDFIKLMEERAIAGSRDLEATSPKKDKDRQQGGNEKGGGHMGEATAVDGTRNFPAGGHGAVCNTADEGNVRGPFGTNHPCHSQHTSTQYTRLDRSTPALLADVVQTQDTIGTVTTIDLTSARKRLYGGNGDGDDGMPSMAPPPPAHAPTSSTATGEINTPVPGRGDEGTYRDNTSAALDDGEASTVTAVATLTAAAPVTASNTKGMAVPPPPPAVLMNPYAASKARIATPSSGISDSVGSPSAPPIPVENIGNIAPKNHTGSGGALPSQSNNAVVSVHPQAPQSTSVSTRTPDTDEQLTRKKPISSIWSGGGAVTGFMDDLDELLDDDEGEDEAVAAAFNKTDALQGVIEKNQSFVGDSANAHTASTSTTHEQQDGEGALQSASADESNSIVPFSGSTAAADVGNSIRGQSGGDGEEVKQPHNSGACEGQLNIKNTALSSSGILGETSIWGVDFVGDLSEDDDD